MITRCDCCIGKKTIIGLGALIKDCPKCKGIGHIKTEEKKEITIESKMDKLVDKFIDVEVEYVNEHLQNSEIKLTRRGRPKKVNDERAKA